MLSSFFDQLDGPSQEQLKQLGDQFDDRLIASEPLTLAHIIKRVDNELRLACVEYLLPISVDPEYLRTGRLLSFAKVNELHQGLEREIEAVYNFLPSDLFMPRELGEFAVQEMLHQGTPAVTARGRHRRTENSVFIKYVDRNQHPAAAERIENEFKLLAKLSHPSILRYHDGHRSGRFSYIATDHLESTTLRDAKRNREWPPTNSAKVVARLCLAVHYLHEQGIIHSDIKPDNIMFNALDEPVLIDFDLATDLNQGHKPYSEIKDHSGTFPFMAPEQFEQLDSDYPQRRDIFSLGGVLGWILTDECPGPAEAQRIKFIEAVNQLPSDLECLRSTILKATQICPSDRFVNSEVMRLQLEKAIAQLTTTPQLISSHTSPTRTKGIAMAVAGAICIVAGVCWLGFSGENVSVGAGEALMTDSPAREPDGLHSEVESTELSITKDRVSLDAAKSFLKWSGRMRGRHWRVDGSKFVKWIPEVLEVRVGLDSENLIHTIRIGDSNQNSEIGEIGEQFQNLPGQILNSKSICVQVHFIDGRVSPLTTGRILGSGEKTFWFP